MVSFSLTTGMTPRASKAPSVARPFRYRLRSCVSDKVSSTCPVLRPWREIAPSQAAASFCCPTAAAACACSRDNPPGGKPSSLRPRAMAPEDTTATRFPTAFKAAMSSARLSSQSPRTSPASGSTKSAEPTLTITVCAVSSTPDCPRSAFSAIRATMPRPPPWVRGPVRSPSVWRVARRSPPDQSLQRSQSAPAPPPRATG